MLRHFAIVQLYCPKFDMESLKMTTKLQMLIKQQLFYP